MKRIIAALMCVTLFAAVIPCAYAQSDRAMSERKKENINHFFDAFPVITKEMTEDEVITRGEFAEIIQNMLEKAEMSGTMRKSVTDNLLEDRPNDVISDLEAISSAVHFLNGEYIININKNYNAGIWDAVKKLNIDIALSGDKKNADWIKKLIYNTLHAYTAEVKGIDGGQSIMGIDESGTYIEKYWDLDKIEGVFTQNSMIDINGKSAAGTNSIVINGNEYISYLTYENSSYIGQYVTAYAVNDGIREGEICCMYPNEKYSASVVINNSNIRNFKNFNSISESIEGRIKKYSISLTADIYYNFDYLGPVRAVDYDSEIIKTVMNEVMNGKSCQIRMIENTGDGKYDFIWIQSFDNYVVGGYSYNNGKIEDLYGERLDIKEAFDDNRVVLFDKDNRLANVTDLQENDVISVITGKNGDAIIQMFGYWSRETVSGRIDKVRDDSYVIDNSTYYACARYLEQISEGNHSTPELKIGLQTTFYLNVFNEIAGVSMNDRYEQDVSYAFIISAYYDANTQEGGVKLLNEDGNVENRLLDKKVSVNGKSYKNEKITERLAELSNEIVDDNMCSVYRMAKITLRDNVIKKIELAFKEVRPDGVSLSQLYPDDILYSGGQNTDGTDVTLADVVYKNNTFGKRVGMTALTVIFDVPLREQGEQAIGDQEAYSVTSVSNMQDDCVLGLGGIKKVGDAAGGAYMEFFDTDNTLFASAAVRYYPYNPEKGGVTTPPEMLADCIVVTDVVTRSVNEDDEPVILIEGYRAGSPVSMITTPVKDISHMWQQFSTLSDSETGAHLETADGTHIRPDDVAVTGVLPGDVIQVTTNAKNEISNILINVRGGESENAAWLMINGNGTNTSVLSAGAGHGNEYLGVNYGTVETFRDGKAVMNELDGKRRVYSIGNPTITVYNRTKQYALKGSTADIERGKDMYIRQYYSQIKEIVIFED